MSVCIVILSYNHPELTARAARSAWALDRSIPVLIVHNGSLPQHVQSLKKEFPRFTHLVLEKNLGFSGGANAGLEYAFQQLSFAWVLFLTNDCEVKTTFDFSRPPALLLPQILWRKSLKIDSVGGLFDPSRGLLKHCRHIDEFKAHNSTWRKYAPGSAFALHRTVWRQVGSFDENLFTFWEDVDYSQRVQEHGFDLVLSPEATILHAGGKTTRKNPLYTLYFFQRNRKWVSRKYARGIISPIILHLELIRSWLKLALHLFQQRRWTDFPLLWRAVWS